MNCLERFYVSIRYILSYIEPNSPILGCKVKSVFEKPPIKNCHSGKVSSLFVSDTISISRLMPTNVTSDSNLFLIEFLMR